SLMTFRAAAASANFNSVSRDKGVWLSARTLVNAASNACRASRELPLSRDARPYRYKNSASLESVGFVIPSFVISTETLSLIHFRGSVSTAVRLDAKRELSGELGVG